MNDIDIDANDVSYSINHYNGKCFINNNSSFLSCNFISRFVFIYLSH